MQIPADLSDTAQSSALGASIGADTLIVVCGVLALIAAMAIASVFIARRETRAAYRFARSRSQTMREFLRTVRMAESIAGIGVWQYDPATGAQQWSDGLKRLFGIDEDEEFVDGDAETLLLANKVDLVAKVSDQSKSKDPFPLHFDTFGLTACRDRSVSMRATCMAPTDRFAKLLRWSVM